MTDEQIKLNAEVYANTLRIGGLGNSPKLIAIVSFEEGAHSRDGEIEELKEEIESLQEQYKTCFDGFKKRGTKLGELMKENVKLRNPWRDAKKELPPRDTRFDNHDTLKGCSKYVLTLSKDGDIVIARYNTITKSWCNFKTYVTRPDFWMPIPELKGGEK